MSIVASDGYSNRQILLLAQLLHINGLGTRQQIELADINLINRILDDFKSHKVMKLEGKSVKITKRAQLLELYDNLLTSFNVTTTVQLANLAYFNRISELEEAMEGYRKEFRNVLDS